MCEQPKGVQRPRKCKQHEVEALLVYPIRVASEEACLGPLWGVLPRVLAGMVMPEAFLRWEYPQLGAVPAIRASIFAAQQLLPVLWVAVTDAVLLNGLACGAPPDRPATLALHLKPLCRLRCQLKRQEHVAHVPSNLKIFRSVHKLLSAASTIDRCLTHDWCQLRSLGRSPGNSGPCC